MLASQLQFDFKRSLKVAILVIFISFFLVLFNERELSTLQSIIVSTDDIPIFFAGYKVYPGRTDIWQYPMSY